ncbi:hypothetical protein [uncultured Ottowia sp.]|uniref:hypothetical protein n=1 Tax=uncultured Ottowia sp. TaxID=543067 RepID=UPI0025936D3B|nr:hypothetical protein [uncultured Ottowia sp.]
MRTQRRAAMPDESRFQGIYPMKGKYFHVFLHGIFILFSWNAIENQMNQYGARFYLIFEKSGALMLDI